MQPSSCEDRLNENCLPVDEPQSVTHRKSASGRAVHIPAVLQVL
jgi:hypothetical protein